MGVSLLIQPGWEATCDVIEAGVLVSELNLCEGEPNTHEADIDLAYERTFIASLPSGS